MHAENAAGKGNNSDATRTVVIGPANKPENVNATVNGRTIVVTWTQGITPMTPTVERFIAGVPGVATCTSPEERTTCTIIGAPTNRVLDIRVAAVNDAGEQWSTSSSSVTLRTPGAPRDFVVTSERSSVRASWDAPAPDGAPDVTGYELRWSDGSIACTTGAFGNACDLPVTALRLGTAYTLTLRALNEIGDGIAATATFTYGSPAAPTGVRIQQRDDNSIRVNWNPALSPLATVSGYVVRTNDGKSCTTNASTFECVITGVVGPKSITVTVSATNTGSGAASIPFQVVAVPAAPTAIRTVGQDRKIVVTWEAAPVADGRPVEGFEVWSSSSFFLLNPEKVCDVKATASTCTVSNLENDVNYVFWVVAKNAAGSSDRSPLSARTSATNIPEVITGPADPVKASSIRVQQFADQLFIRWDPVTKTGGARLVQYAAMIVQTDPNLWILGGCRTYGTTCSVSLADIDKQLGQYWAARRDEVKFYISIVVSNGGKTTSEETKSGSFQLAK